jgi:hypothetical protein
LCAAFSSFPVYCVNVWHATSRSGGREGKSRSREGNGIAMELFVYILYGNVDNFEDIFITIYNLIPFKCIVFAAVFIEV